MDNQKELPKNEEQPQDNFVEGFALSGAEVKNSEKKQFVIVDEPHYVEFEKDEGKVDRRLLLKINFNNAVVDYYANKTSQAVIVAQKGRDLKSWVGFQGTFETLSQKVGKDLKDVIYIIDPNAK